MTALVANHLLQSTLFAAAAALLTLVLKKNHARARYWLWLAASLKFLIPFSLLVDLGSRLGWSTPHRVIRRITVMVEGTASPGAPMTIHLSAPEATHTSLPVLLIL